MKAMPLAACASAIVALMTMGCKTNVTQGDAVRPVRAMKVGDLKVLEGRDFPGRAKARYEVDLSFQVSGPLVSLPVDVGSEVKKGDVIAAIDPRDFQAALESNQGNLERARANLLAMERGARPEEIEQLKAAVDEAEATYREATKEHERNANLIKTGGVTKTDFDRTLARVERTAAKVKKAKEDLNIGRAGARPEDLEAKRAEIKALEAAVLNATNQLEYSVLAAPFDGEVAARFVDNFQTVQAKQPIVRLLDVAKIEVTVQVPESLISLVPRVKEAICRFDAIPGREFTGHVTKIGSEASQTTRTYPVTVEVEQPSDVQILPGMAAIVRAKANANENASKQDLVVPPSAILTGEDGKQSFVWVVQNGGHKVQRREIKTGKLTSVGVTITEGLQPGEWIVTTGVHSLRDDQEVKLLKQGEQ